MEKGSAGRRHTERAYNFAHLAVSPLRSDWLARWAAAAELAGNVNWLAAADQIAPG
jgi:hypothetical protein